MPEVGAGVDPRWAECSAHHARGWIPLGSDGASSRLFGTQSCVRAARVSRLEVGKRQSKVSHGVDAGSLGNDREDWEVGGID